MSTTRSVSVPRIKTLAAALSIALAGAAFSIDSVNAATAPSKVRSMYQQNTQSKQKYSALKKLDMHHARDGAMHLAQSLQSGSSAAARGASTVHVSSLGDSGAGSLRDALSNAVNGDVIDLSGLRGNIRLSKPLAIDASISIRGPGRELLTLTGSGTDRVLTSSHSLRLSNVTVAHGATPHADAPALGGCLFVAGDVTLTNATLTDCTADGSATTSGYAYGGALAVVGSLSMDSSSITNSSATAPNYAGGGGVFVINTPTSYQNGIVNSTITGNSATGGQVVNGAGIGFYYYDSNYNTAQTSITGSTITGNTGTATSIPAYYYDGTTYYYGNAFGGGVFARGGNVTLTSSNVSGNTVTANQFASGGGVYVIAGYYGDGGGAQMDGGTISSNTSASIYRFATGGGLQVHAASSLTNAVISGNQVNSACLACLNYGGGVYLGKYGSVTVTASTISGNSVTSTAGGASAGGGITTKYQGSYNVITLNNSTLSGNTVTATADDTQAFGGGIYQAGTGSPGSLIANNSTIAFNTAGGVGGGVLIGYGATVTLNSTIMANTADYLPGTSDFGTPSTATVGGDYNLVKTDPTSSGITITGTHTILGEDPLLLPLANNGGSTPTHALDPESPAIDKGSNTLPLTYDQRGNPYPRVVGAAADIGAFELDTDHIFGNGFE